MNACETSWVVQTSWTGMASLAEHKDDGQAPASYCFAGNVLSDLPDLSISREAINPDLYVTSLNFYV